MFCTIKRALFFLILSLFVLTASAQRLDFNLMGRQPRQVTAIGFMPWALQQVQKETNVIDRDKNITMTVEAEKGGPSDLRMVEGWCATQ